MPRRREMKRSTGSIAVLVMAASGWACSASTGKDEVPNGWEYADAPPPGVVVEDAQAPIETIDAGVGYPVPPTLDAGIGYPVPFPTEDAGVGCPTEDSSAPFPMEDASAPYPTEDASFPFLDAGIGFDSSFPVPDAAPPICTDPPPGASACWASCCTPAGPNADLSSAAQVTSAITGAWQFCSAIDRWHVVGPSDAAGVEFTSDGLVYFLVPQAGGLVRGPGFLYQWSYQVEPVDGTFQVSLFPSDDSGFSSAIRYSPCPRELQLDALDLGEPAFLVPAP
jgi:hypothetical protein